MVGWTKAIQETAQMLDAIALMCNISDSDYAKYHERRTQSIGDKSVRVAVYAFSADFGDLLDIIARNLCAHANNSSVPSSCSVPEIDLSVYRNAWTKHINTEAQSQIELANIVGETRDNILTRLKALRDEDGGGDYSSYSDYSEETDSDESEDEDDDEDDEGDEDDEDDEDEKGHRPSRQKNDKDKDRHKKHRN
tara:strand:+ start:1188 stop:1769 length:582 start_codon:yes stop_codon:yes gene_type:complete